MRVKVAAVLMVLASAAHAEDPRERAAREELERELSQLVEKAPSRVRVDFVSPDEPNYVLESASFELDGRVLGSPPPLALSAEGTHPVWSGEVTAGKHTVAVRLVFANRASALVTDEGGYKWKVGGEVSFDVHSGIEVQVKAAPVRDGKQADVAKRFRLTLPARPVMVGKLDDGKLPEPPPKPALAVDAGPSPAQVAEAEAKRAAAEAEAKRAAAEAETKRAAAEAETKRAAAEAEAKRAAVEAEAETRRVAAAAAATRAVAEQGGQRTETEVAAKRPVVEPGPGTAEARTTDASPVPPTEVEAAGPSVAVAAVGVVPDAGPSPVGAQAASAPGDAGGPDLAVLGGVAVAALVALIAFARRRARPPRIDE